MSYFQIQLGGKSNAKGAKYVNLAWSKWDKVKKRSVQKRLYIGKLTEDEQGVLINKRFTGGVERIISFSELNEHVTDRVGFEGWLRSRVGDITFGEEVSRIDIVGDVWFTQHFAKTSGLTDTLVEAFGERDGHALAGLASHQLVTGNALYRASDWLSQRELPPTWKSSLTSDSVVHGFIARIGEDVKSREAFLQAWVQNHKDNEAVVYDTTSISSYSPSLELAEWGYNRDDEFMPQINFSIGATQEGMPLFYRVLPGSIPDVRTLSNTLHIISDYGIENIDLSLDRGFFSAANLRDLLKLNYGFTIGVPWTTKQAQNLLKRNRKRLESPRHAFLYNSKPMRHVTDVWEHENVKLSAHLFFDPERHIDSMMRVEKQVLDIVDKANDEKFKTLNAARQWINDNVKSRAACLRYFQTDDGTIKVDFKPASLASASARSGYTLIITHNKKDVQETATSVLDNYRNRDMVEKLFDFLKTEHKQYRLRTANDASVEGRFFLGFITLIIRAELEKRLRVAKLHKKMTTANVLDQAGKIKSFTTVNGKRILLEVSKAQRQLCSSLKVPEIT